MARAAKVVEPWKLAAPPIEAEQLKVAFFDLWEFVKAYGDLNGQGKNCLQVLRVEIDKLQTASANLGMSDLARNLETYGRSREDNGLLWVTSSAVYSWLCQVKDCIAAAGEFETSGQGSGDRASHRRSFTDRHGIPVQDPRSHFKRRNPESDAWVN